MTDTLVLGRQAGSEQTQFSLEGYIREQAKFARAELDDERHAAALDALAERISLLPREDQRLRAIWLTQSNSDSFVPGEAVSDLLARIGAGVPAPADLGVTVNELVAASVEDYRDQQARERAAVGQAVQDAESRAARAEQNDQARAELVEKLDTRERELADARAEIEKLSRKLDTLSRREPKKPTKARRSKAKEAAAV